jgi:SAM-dependent methyltransferase
VTDAAYIPLPIGLTDPRATAGAVFDRVASLYDRARPGYPVEAVRDLDGLVGIAGSGRILGIGCGTGQLTRDLAPTGAAIDCLEPGPSLAATARANLVGYPNVTVTVTGFEDFDASAGSYDVVVSATAFHWIDPCVSYAKASSLLRPGGHLVVVAKPASLRIHRHHERACVLEPGKNPGIIHQIEALGLELLEIRSLPTVPRSSACDTRPSPANDHNENERALMTMTIP